MRRSRSQKFLTFLKENVQKYLRTWVSNICSEFSHFTQIVFFIKNFLPTYERTKRECGEGTLDRVWLGWYHFCKLIFQFSIFIRASETCLFLMLCSYWKTWRLLPIKVRTRVPDKIFDHYCKFNDSACCAYTRCSQKLIQLAPPALVLHVW